jgi:hypothetical protein
MHVFEVWNGLQNFLGRSPFVWSSDAASKEAEFIGRQWSLLKRCGRHVEHGGTNAFSLNKGVQDGRRTPLLATVFLLRIFGIITLKTPGVA